MINVLPALTVTSSLAYRSSPESVGLPRVGSVALSDSSLMFSVFIVVLLLFSVDFHIR